MQINSINSTENYKKGQYKANSNVSAPNFKGIADLPGMIMQGIEKGGFATSFIVQDTLGMTVPRTWEGLNRGVENKNDQKDKKFSLKNMNLKEGAEVFLREALSGPIMMFTPMLVLLLGRKYVGKSTFTNSSLIKRLGNSLKSVVSTESHANVDSLRTSFYKNSLKNVVQNTTNAVDKNAEADFIEKAAKAIERLDIYSQRAGKSKLRKKALKRQESRIVEMFNQYHTTNSSDYSMVNKVKFDGQVYSTSSFVKGLRGYADDALKNKQISDITPEYTSKVKNVSLIKRGITNILAAFSTIGAVSIVPKLYSLINPVPPGASNVVENSTEKTATAPEKTAVVADKAPTQTVQKQAVPNKNGSNVSFTGKWDALAKNLEFNGNNLTPALMTVLATGGLLGPRVKTAVDRAPENPVTKKKDYSEVPEILTRDITSTLAVTFGVPLISKALVSSYENASGFVLQNHPAEKLKGFKKFLDIINPLSGINPYSLSDLNTIYGSVDSKEKLNTFSQFVDKNNGSLAKIFKTTKDGKKVFNEHGLNIEELAAQADRKLSNRAIINAANSSEEFANKLIALIGPNAKGKASNIVKRARTLNSITTCAATVALVPAFLGIILPKIVYAQTAKRQKRNQEQMAALQAQNTVSNNIDYSKLIHANNSTFNKIKHS